MIELFRPITHIILHIGVPAIIARWLTIPRYRSSCTFTDSWRQAFVVMMLTMVVDLDHLMADPIYQADRCSINFHLLHMPIPILAYLLLCWPKKTRVIGIGLIIHMMLDGLDCWLMLIG